MDGSKRVCLLNSAARGVGKVLVPIGECGKSHGEQVESDLPIFLLVFLSTFRQTDASKLLFRYVLSFDLVRSRHVSNVKREYFGRPFQVPHHVGNNTSHTEQTKRKRNTATRNVLVVHMLTRKRRNKYNVQNQKDGRPSSDQSSQIKQLNI